MNNIRVVFYERNDGVKGFKTTPEISDLDSIRKTVPAKISQELVDTLMDTSKTSREEVEELAKQYLEN